MMRAIELGEQKDLQASRLMQHAKKPEQEAQDDGSRLVQDNVPLGAVYLNCM